MAEAIIESVTTKVETKTSDEARKERQRQYAKERYHKKKAEKEKAEKEKSVSTGEPKKDPEPEEYSNSSSSDEEEQEVKPKPRKVIKKKVYRRKKVDSDSESSDDEEEEGYLSKILSNGYVRAAAISVGLYALSRGINKVKEMRDGMDLEMKRPRRKVVIKPPSAELLKALSEVSKQRSAEPPTEEKKSDPAAGVGKASEDSDEEQTETSVALNAMRNFIKMRMAEQ